MGSKHNDSGDRSISNHGAMRPKTMENPWPQMKGASSDGRQKPKVWPRDSRHLETKAAVNLVDVIDLIESLHAGQKAEYRSREYKQEALGCRSYNTAE